MRKLVAFFAALAIGVVAACGGDSTTQPTMASLDGSWSLQTVNGAALPFVAAQSGQDKEEIMSDVFTTSSGTFAEQMTVRTTISGQATMDTLPDSGSYALSGSTVTFTFSDSSTASGTVSGNTMTFVESGYRFVYKKQ